MNWGAVGAIAEPVGAEGVIVTLAYLAVEIRDSNRVARAQSRQSITEFINQIVPLRMTLADRLAGLALSGSLTRRRRIHQVG